MNMEEFTTPFIRLLQNAHNALLPHRIDAALCILPTPRRRRGYTPSLCSRPSLSPAPSKRIVIPQSAPSRGLRLVHCRLDRRTPQRFFSCPRTIPHRKPIAGHSCMSMSFRRATELFPASNQPLGISCGARRMHLLQDLGSNVSFSRAPYRSVYCYSIGLSAGHTPPRHMRETALSSDFPVVATAMERCRHYQRDRGR